MNVTFNTDGNSVVITIAQEATRSDFDAVFKSLDALKSVEEIRIDLKNLFNMKSVVIAQVLAIKKTAGSKNARTVLLNVSENVYQVLEMSGLLHLFIIRQDFGRYGIEELIDMFHKSEYADTVSDYISANYCDSYRDALMPNAESEDSQIREYCILTMGKAQDTDATEVIRKGMDSIYPNVVRAAILALGWLGDNGSKERFYSFISSHDVEVAEAAGASISLVSDDNDPERLRKLSESENPNIRMIVAGTLSLINGDDAYNLITEMLDSEKDESVRKVLVRRLAFFNKPDATMRLIAMLDDHSMAVQESAAAGLERTGLRGHEDAVLKKVAGEDIWVSYFAVRALGQNCNAESAKYLKEIYGKVEENVKLAIVEALGNTAIDMDVFFTERLLDSNEDIRKGALSALYKSHKEIAVLEAIKLLRNDPSWLVRYKAIEIIGKEKPEGYEKVLTGIKEKDDNRYIQEKIASVLGA